MLSRRAAAKWRRDSGFALVEVLVAAAVAAVLMTALIRAFANNWSGVNSVREETEAMLVARSVLEAVAPRSTLAPGAQQGATGRYNWSVEIAKEPIPPLAAAPRNPLLGEPAAQTVPRNLYRVAIVVAAPSGRRTTLETLRLATPPR
jgi:prepilin-type N-terminal cleavage/methylation domain-containing protein